MSEPKETPKRNHRRKAVPVLRAAGLSLALASGASTAVVNAHQLPPPVRGQITLHEEEISEVSLATFHVFDKENGGARRQRLQLAFGGCGACGGCGCACGIGLYKPYNPPAFSTPVYPPPPQPVRPPHKYRHRSR